MTSFFDDIRYGLRTLMRARGFTVTALLSLGLGIGANTAVFSLVNELLLRPLPITEPDRLVRVRARFSHTSYPNYLDFRDGAAAVAEDITGHRVASFDLAAGAAEAVRIIGEMAAPNYFTVLGVEAARGRVFREEVRGSEVERTAVLSHGCWMRRFSGDPAVLGRRIRLNGVEHTVIGVLPPGFRGTFPLGLAPEVWAVLSPELAGGGERLYDRSNFLLELVARLRPGVAPEQAHTVFTTVAQRLEAEYPAANRGLSGVEVTRLSGSGLLQGFGPAHAVAGFLAVLSAIVALVLLIACANVGNVLLARAAGRQREIAVRLAVGAGRLRLVRQMMTESLLLALGGGGLGLLLAWWSADLFRTLPAALPFPLELDLQLDWRVFAYTLAVSLATAFLFGLAPALQAARPDVASFLKVVSASSRGAAPPHRARRALVVAEVAVSLLLLIGAGLFLRSLMKIHETDPGFEVARGLTASFDLPPARYGEEQGRLFCRQLLARVEALPGVQSASAAKIVPLTFSNMEMPAWKPGQDPAAEPGVPVYANNVAPRYFETMRIPVVRGRGFSWRDDRSAPAVAVISESLAKRMFPGRDPIGQTLVFPLGRLETGPVEIVGVVRDTKYRTLGEDPASTVYFPMEQAWDTEVTLHLLAAGDPRDLAAAVRDEIGHLDDSLALSIQPMERVMETAFLPARVGAALFGAFGLLGLVLASIGIFGVVAYSVGWRVPEIGVRIALGAGSGEVLRMVVADGMRLVGAGIAIGLIAAIPAARLLSGFLAGVSAWDIPAFGGVSALLAVVALAACYLPARRAAAVDPASALRNE